MNGAVAQATVSFVRMHVRFVGLAALALVVSACGHDATPSGASDAPPAATRRPSATVAGRDAPPDALLAAEGGDPVPGQLGTFVWFATGSDTPWLPGAPLTVGAGEPLTADLVPDVGVRAWSARFVPAAAAGPDGAIARGGGVASPRFDAPGPGAWTLELFVEFPAGAGNARYFWRLEVE